MYIAQLEFPGLPEPRLFAFDDYDAAMASVERTLSHNGLKYVKEYLIVHRMPRAVYRDPDDNAILAVVEQVLRIERRKVLAIVR